MMFAPTLQSRGALLRKPCYITQVSKPLTLGPAREDELLRLAALSRDLVEQGLGWTYTATALSRAQRRHDHELVVARNETGPLGFGLMQLGQDTAHLVLLVVDVPFRRRGIATALMDWLEVMARTAGVFDIDLEVRFSNLDARGFYRQRGYHPVSRIVGYYRGVEDAVRMRADLRVRA